MFRVCYGYPTAARSGYGGELPANSTGSVFGFICRLLSRPAAIGVRAFGLGLTMKLLIWLCIAIGSAGAQEQTFMTIGTGGVTGVYYPAGQAICRSINKIRSEHGVRCAAETGRGSIGNLQDLMSGNIDFAVVQADWLHHAFLGTSAFQETGPLDGLRTVIGLHTELATIVVRKETEFNGFDDLKAARINIGAPGSGTAATWALIADRLKWPEAPSGRLRQEDLSGLGEALCGGAIDAYFVFIGQPAGVIDDTRALCDVQLIGIGGRVADALSRDAPYYHPAEIPAGLYGAHGAIATFGTDALVVTTSSMPAKAVATVIEAVIRDFDTFVSAHPALGRLKPGDLVKRDAGAPLHSGALKIFQEQGYLP